MKLKKEIYLLIFLSILTLSSFVIFGLGKDKIQNSENSNRRLYKLNTDWRFQLGDGLAFSNDTFNDSSWRLLNIPHDWSVEGVYDTIYGTDWQSGYLPAGIGWYRKELILKEDPTAHTIELQFDGVYMNSSVWVNGHFIGNHKYGYTAFHYDVTSYLRKGKNTIAVKVDHSKPKSGRWYTGSGIYRNVWLKVLPKTHFKSLEQYVDVKFLNDSLVMVEAHAELLNKNNDSVKGKLVQKIFDENLKFVTSEEKEVSIASKDSILVSQKNRTN